VTNSAHQPVIEHLDRLYCQHIVNSMWAEAVGYRLEGLPLVILQDDLKEIAESHHTTAVALAERITDLGSAPTADPRLIVSGSADGDFALPENCGSTRQILHQAVAALTDTVAAYRAALDAVTGDPVTAHLLVKLLGRQERNLADATAANA
jgi:ferritin-like protein